MTNKLIPALLILLSVVACSTMQPTTDSAPENPSASEQLTSGPDVEWIAAHEARVAQALEAYGVGIELLESGNAESAYQVMDDALYSLDQAVEECRLQAGCDLGGAVDAYRTVLNLQSGLGAADDAEDYSEPVSADNDSGETRVVAGRSLNGVDLADVIVLNQYVKDEIHDWLTWNKPNLIETYENFRFLREEMVPAYADAGLPEALLFGILAVESGGRVHSFSRAGAAGPLQFMRATGRRYGLRDVDGFDERLSPSRATQANVRYLNDQFQEFDYSLEKALAAYNGGENRVKRLHQRTRRADFWSSDFYYALPSDTRKYVPQVLAAAWLYLHPEDYRLHLPAGDTKLDELVLDQELSISELSICLGNDTLDNGWFRALRNLNPQLDPGERVAAGTSLRVPEEVVQLYPEQCIAESDFLALAAQLRDASEERESGLVPYVIRSGDTLSRIAARHRCMSLRELAAINNIAPPRYFLRAGKTIQVPSC